MTVGASRQKPASGGASSTSGSPSGSGGTSFYGGSGGSDAEAGRSGADDGGSGGVGGGQAGGGGSDEGGSAGTGGKAGAGGTGGAGEPTVTCATKPLTARNTWVATASHESIGNGMESDGLYNPASHLLDSSMSERWSSGKPQNGDEWLQIDFGAAVTLSRVTMQHGTGTDAADYARSYTLRVSNTAQDFNATVRAMGTGALQTATIVNLPAPATGRYLTIRQTGIADAGEWWSIAELQVACVD